MRAAEVVCLALQWHATAACCAPLQVKEHVTPDVPIVCTCAHGRRGGDAAAQLAATGHEKIVNLAGGLAAWSDASLPHSGQIKRHH